MAARQGYTLMELTVVLLIIGIATAFTLPGFISSIEQTKAQVAQNNLYAIAAAQQKYFEDRSAYCLVGCGDTTANLNANLYLGISDSFNYRCVASGAYYSCTARDGTDTLTLRGINVAGNTATGNSVSCSGPKVSYCPS